MLDRDLTALEKAAGKKAARTIQRNWKAILRIHSKTGVMINSATARAVIKNDSLDSIAVTASPVTFKQHYGFEGTAKNGRIMSMKPYDHFDKLFDKSQSAFEKLLNEVAEIRGEQVASKIQEVIKITKEIKIN